MSDGSLRFHDLSVFDLNDESVQPSLIPFDKCKANILFLCGEDDQCMPALALAQQGAQLMDKAGKSNYKVKTIYVPNDHRKKAL